MEGQRPRVARVGVAQLGESAQEAKRLIEFIDEIIRYDECAFADTTDSGIGVALRLIANGPRRLWC